MDINWIEILKFTADILVLSVIAGNCINIKRIEKRLNRLEGKR